MTAAVIIRGGTVVNADASVRADVLCEGGTIRAGGKRLTGGVYDSGTYVALANPAVAACAGERL